MNVIYKCNECDSVFTEPNKIRHRHTELDEGDWYETFEVCPVCRGDDFEEIHQCEVCGEPIPSTEFLCKDCEKGLSSEQTVIDFGAEVMEDVSVNSLITYHYSPFEINEILMDHLKGEKQYKAMLEDFVDGTHDEFVDYIMEQEGLV